MARMAARLLLARVLRAAQVVRMSAALQALG